MTPATSPFPVSTKDLVALEHFTGVIFRVLFPGASILNPMNSARLTANFESQMNL